MGLEWVRVDSARILAIMPVELVGLYDKWVRERPDRAARLREIVRGVVAEFRAVLYTNPGNVINPNENMLPLPFVRYAEILILGALHREMAVPMSEIEQSRQIRAEIMLRTFYSRGLLIAPAEPSTVNVGVGSASYRPGVRVDCGRKYGPLIGGGAGIAPVGADDDVPTGENGYVYYGQADGLLDFFAFSAWASASAAGWRIPDPVEGETTFTLSVVPPAANLVIAYPVSVRELNSAVQQSTGVEARKAWIDSPHSAVVPFDGGYYRLYQWIPAFAWENGDSFRVSL